MTEKKYYILRWQSSVKVCQGVITDIAEGVSAAGVYITFIYQFFIQLFIIKFLLGICIGRLFCSGALCWTNDAV